MGSTALIWTINHRSLMSGTSLFDSRGSGERAILELLDCNLDCGEPVRSKEPYSEVTTRKKDGSPLCLARVWKASAYIGLVSGRWPTTYCSLTEGQTCQLEKLLF